MAHVTKRDTASGPRYDVRWQLPDGKERRKTFKISKDANTYRRQVEADELRGVVTDPARNKITLAEMVDRWIKARSTKRTGTVKLDRMIMDRHVLPVLGDRRIGSITRADVQALVDGWAGTDLAASTIGRMYSALRAVFSFAESDDIVTRSPCRGIRLPSARLVDRPYLAPADLERLADALGEPGAVFMWVGAVLGLRWAEAAGLRVCDVNIDAGSVSVVNQLGRDGLLAAPKTVNAVRTLAAPAWLIDALAGLCAGREAGELVFRADKGGPLIYTHWRRLKWVPACTTAGLDGLRFHDLRSLAATALVAAGVDVKTAQTRLGHSSPTVTLGLYARATATADRLAADAVGDLYRPGIKRQIEEIGE